jgi:Rubrerythrin
MHTKDFSDLSEQELVALAVSLEEEDARIYDEFAQGLRETYPDTARMFAAMADEETGHRHRLFDLYRDKFGDHMPLIRRQDVRGFIQRKPVWLSRPLGLDKVRAPQFAHETPRSGNSSATSRQKNGDTKPRQKSSKSDSFHPTCESASTRQNVACLCYRSFSPDSPG